MTEKRFAELRALVQSDQANAMEQRELLEHADQLRDAVIESINERDRWDEDWHILGYQHYVPGDPDAAPREYEALCKRHQR